MPYSLTMIGREPRRYLPAVLAVAFSDLLITVQVGLLLGALAVLSLPIDHCAAEVWVASPEVLSIELGYPIPESLRGRLASLAAVVDTEPYLYGFSYWRKPRGGSEVCCVIGSRLEAGALGVVSDLTPQMRTLLTEPGAVVVDESERDRLGVPGVGGIAEVAGQRVRVVGLVQGLKSLGPPYVFCSLRTASLLQPLFRDYPQHTMYLLARCRNPEDAPAVARRLGRRSDLSAFTREEFSARTQLYWATRTEAGIGMGFTAFLSLLVGLVITSQTLYAATVASLREYAVLRALGIPRWRMAGLVMAQSFWVGLGGIGLALPLIFAMAAGGDSAGARVLLPPWLLAAGTGVTLAMALLSGLAALRSLRLVEPITLLR
ncbi:MAG TPA: ABC transporter permease [Isosphaeraceae bacterium]|nr:ABC transporter permease [Isosphaeraceae bacterium]